MYIGGRRMKISIDKCNMIHCQLSNLNNLIYTRTLKMLLILILLFTGCDLKKDKDLDRVRRITETITSPQYGQIWESKYDYICQYPLLITRRMPISKLNYSGDTVKINLDLLLFENTNRSKQNVTLTFERGKYELLWLTSLTKGSIEQISGLKELLPILGIFLFGIICSFVGRAALVSKKHTIAIIAAFIGMVSLFGIVPAFVYFYWKASYGASILAIFLGSILGGGFLIISLISDAIKEGNKSNLVAILLLVIGIFYSFNNYSKTYELLDKRAIVSIPNTATSMNEFLSNVRQNLILRGFQIVSEDEINSNPNIVLPLLMNQEGYILLDDKPIYTEEVGLVLRSKIVENPQLILSIRVDKAANPKDISGIFDPIQYAGVSKIHLASLNKKNLQRKIPNSPRIPIETEGDTDINEFIDEADLDFSPPPPPLPDPKEGNILPFSLNNYDEPPTPQAGYKAITSAIKLSSDRRNMCSGKQIIINALISKNDGNVIETRILRSSGYSDCDQAVIKVIKKSKWNPAKKNNMPVTAWATLRMSL